MMIAKKLFLYIVLLNYHSVLVANRALFSSKSYVKVRKMGTLISNSQVYLLI